LTFQVRGRPGELTFALTHELNLAPLFSEVRPFLRGLPLNLDAISFDGRIDRLQTGARFNGGRLTAFNSTAVLPPGPILSVQIPKLYSSGSEAFFESLELQSGSRTSPNDGLHLNIAASSTPATSTLTDLSVDVGPIRLRATDHQNRNYHVGLSLNSEVRTS